MKLLNDDAYTLEVNINSVNRSGENLYEFILESKFNNEQLRIDKHYFNKETLLQLSDYIKNSI
jgi:hypothetical protein